MQGKKDFSREVIQSIYGLSENDVGAGRYFYRRLHAAK